MEEAEADMMTSLSGAWVEEVSSGGGMSNRLGQNFDQAVTLHVEAHATTTHRAFGAHREYVTTTAKYWPVTQ